jgi:hypothetical protein
MTVPTAVASLLAGQCLSLADYVALREAHGRDACRRRVPQVAYAPAWEAVKTRDRAGGSIANEPNF